MPRSRIDRLHHAFGRLDDLAGIEAEILAIAHRHDLHAGAQLVVAADRHGEAGQAEQGRQQGRAHRLQDVLLALDGDVTALLGRQIAKRRQDHQRPLLEEGHPAQHQSFALGQRRNVGRQIDRLVELQPRLHGGDGVGIAHLLHLRPQAAEDVGDADLMPQLDAALHVGRQDLLDDIARRLQMLAGEPHGGGLRGMRRAARHLGHDRDLDGPRRRRALHGHVVPAPVAAIAARHDFERKAGIAHRAGVRALDRHQHGADRPALSARWD